MAFTSNTILTAADLNVEFDKKLTIANNVVNHTISVNVNTSNTAFRVTQEGSGNAFVVEDSTNPDSTPFIIRSTGNVAIGATTANNKLNVVGNAHINGSIGIGAAPSSTATLYLTSTNSTDANWNEFSQNSRISNSTITAARTKTAKYTFIRNESQHKNSSNTNQNSSVYGYQNHTYNGNSVSSVDARVNILNGIYNVVAQYSNGTSSNTVGIMYGISNWMRIGSVSSGNVGTVYGVYNYFYPLNSTVSCNVTGSIAMNYSRIDGGNGVNYAGVNYIYRGVISGNTSSFASNNYGIHIYGEDLNYFSGKVGIANSLPSATLEVTGTAKISANVNIDGNTVFIDTTNNRLGIANGSPSVELEVTGSATISGNVTIGSSFVDTTNERIGANTTAPTAALDINSDKFRVRTAKTPSSASATGTTGDICWDASYIYICVGTNTWKRAAISTWT